MTAFFDEIAQSNRNVLSNLHMSIDFQTHMRQYRNFRENPAVFHINYVTRILLL